MSNDKDSLFQKSYELAVENNKMLKSMLRNQRLATVARAIYWLVVIGAAVGLYYYIQPFTDPIVETYGSFRVGISNFAEFFNSTTTPNN